VKSLTSKRVALDRKSLCKELYGVVILIFCTLRAKKSVNFKMACFTKCCSYFLQIAHFKIPRHVRFMSDFPKTVSGKIQKFQLQKIVLEEKSLGTG
jgi:acyl-coenzyme A synthetase/AMP-(fatty) acid ligase